MRCLVLWLLGVAVLSGLLILGTTFCEHAMDLAEVVRTYSSFYPHLQRHPEILYDGTSTTSTLPPIVPRHIHQILLTGGGPSKFDKYGPAIESCRSAHEGWNHTLWDDEAAESFMQTHYPDIHPHFIGYRQDIQRANVLRYALLHHYGGIYLDVDITCRQSLEPLRHIPFLTPGAYPAGVNNAFILSRQGHPFLGNLLAALKSRDLSWGMPYVENMLSTGCMFFSNQWMKYVRSSGTALREDRVYILADEDGDLDPHMLRGVVTTPLFIHGGASSWHGWDAAMIGVIGRHYQLLAGLLLLSVVVLIAGLFSVRSTRNQRRRSWTATTMAAKRMLP